MTASRSHGSPPPPSRDIDVAAAGQKTKWRAPEETPVAFVYSRRNYAVMLASPYDMEDFAVGFSLTERVVDVSEEIAEIDIHQSERGIELHIKIDPARLERLDIRQQRRNLIGRAGCGVCGLENAEVFFEALPKVSEERMQIDQAALSRALRAFRNFQPLNAQTKTVHGAAWVGLDGEVRFAREDIGRHNALDKLLGALARSDAPMNDGFLLMSSRCSYEIIEKSARRGVRAVACLSGPTAFAIRKAAEANIALYCRNENGAVEVLG